MLNVYLGNFHPDLEEALCTNISNIRSADCLAPIAIVVPSDRIRDRIKILLTRERGMNLMGVHFLTFYTLAIRLYKEKYGLMRRLTGDDFFFIEFIRHMIKTDAAGTETFRYLSETPDGCAALWMTVQDLRDAKAVPDNIIEGIREGIFGPEDIERITPLILFYKEFLLRKKDADIFDYSDLPEIAAELVTLSAYIQGFKEIIYYGFYDLTQVQYDLFRAVIQHCPVTLYFPSVEKMPAFSFARRFFEGYIQGIVSSPGRIIRLSEPVLTKSGKETLFPFGHLSKIISTSGAEDEVLTVAKGILQLVDSEGYSLSDIGVVAREIDDYGALIKRIFDTHKIPFVSSAKEPVNQYQITKAVHLLISIPEGGYRRSDIIDLVSSYYCNIRLFCPDGIEPRPDIWDTVTRSTGISKGINEWHRLDKYIEEGFIIHRDRDDENNSQMVRGPLIKGLLNFVLSVKEDFSNLPESSSWSDYTARFKALIQKYINTEVFIEETLLSLKEFDLISNEVTLSEFIDTLRRRLESESVPVGGKDIEGVQVLDAMSARCIPFKVLFILGMNEKVFPRNIREDPLLRDSARGILEKGLGYKITEKLYGFEEEKLLFYLLLSSAAERIIILYQRTDDAGQIKIPSLYLSELKRGYPVKELRIPRRMPDKFSTSELFSYHLLTPWELTIRLIIEGRDPSPIMLKFNLNYALYQNGIKTIQSYEDTGSGLTRFDGLTGEIDSHWKSILQFGISPTSLEMYARCPFSYYACHVLGLSRLTNPESVSEVQPVHIGSICHEILRRFYTGMIDIRNSMDIDRHLEETSSVVFREFFKTNPSGYPLLLEVLQKRVLTTLKSMIENDLNEIAASGFRPHSFEVDARGFFSDEVPDYMKDIFLHGVLDRIDVKSDTGQFRIIDYKFRSGKGINSEDKNLSLSAVRGKRLQPPLYLLMAAPHLKTTGVESPVPERVSFYFIAPRWSGAENSEKISDFPGNCWQTSLGEQIKITVALLLKGIKDGLFFIKPGIYCDNCEYSIVCRKNHFPTRWRAERDERVRPYHGIRHDKIKNKI